MRNEETMCEGLLSVVIPVYNIRDYVERCVRSVLAQPDVPLEVLIVDDGSTDDSGAVCDALAAEDSRVTVFHKPNGGLSDARNYGLCHAQGEYILFMDGDDWLAENVCPGLLQMALQDRADVVIGKAHFLREEPVMTRWEEAVEKNFTFHTVYTGKEYLLKCLQTGGLRVEVGRHLYRTGFLRANGLQFCKGILHEDEEFTPRVLLQAQRVCVPALQQGVGLGGATDGEQDRQDQGVQSVLHRVVLPEDGRARRRCQAGLGAGTIVSRSGGPAGAGPGNAKGRIAAAFA